MADESLDFLLKTAGREYLRARLDVVIQECFDAANPEPIQKFVQKLVLAGPSTLEILQDILGDVHFRRDQVQDDLNQVLDGLRDNLSSYGIQLQEGQQLWKLAKGKPDHILELCGSLGIDDAHLRGECLQLVRDSHELVKTLRARLNLLDEMNVCVEDWMWGMYYQSTRPPASHARKGRHH